MEIVQLVNSARTAEALFRQRVIRCTAQGLDSQFSKDRVSRRSVAWPVAPGVDWIPWPNPRVLRCPFRQFGPGSRQALGVLEALLRAVSIWTIEMWLV